MRIQSILFEYNKGAMISLGDKAKIAIDNDESEIARQTSKNQYFIDDLINLLDNADPTPTKKYTEWMYRMYYSQRGKLKLEDLVSVVADKLYLFHNLKTRGKITGAEADINTYRTPNDFLDFVEQKSNETSEKKIQDRGDYDVMVDNASVRIIIPKDEASSKFWGKGTRWCTSGDNDNLFDEYSEKGNLYVIIPKAPKSVGEKYQYWPAGDDYIMNEKNVKLTFNQKIQLQQRLNLSEYFSSIPECKDQLMAMPLPEIEEEIDDFKQQTHHIGKKISEGFYIVPPKMAESYLKMFKKISDLRIPYGHYEMKLKTLQDPDDYWRSERTNDEILNIWFLVNFSDMSTGAISVESNHDRKLTNAGINKDIQIFVKKFLNDITTSDKSTEQMITQLQNFSVSEDHFLKQNVGLNDEEMEIVKNIERNRLIIQFRDSYGEPFHAKIASNRIQDIIDDASKRK